MMSAAARGRRRARCRALEDEEIIDSAALDEGIRRPGGVPGDA